MSTNLLTVTNRVLLLGLDNLYRSAMKRHESSELLECAREVTAILKVDSIDVPTEGYYTESPELTEYFQLMRGLQRQPETRATALRNSAAYARLVEVTASPLYGTPSRRDSLLPAGIDPLTAALTKSHWTLEEVTKAAYKIAADSTGYSLVALASLARDAVALTALRESVVLYAEIVLGSAAWSEPEYVWEVDEVIVKRSQQFVETFNRLFSETLPIPSPENASIFWEAHSRSTVMGRCVRIGTNDSVIPEEHYHWAIDRTEKHELKVVEFWDKKVWTTQQYRQGSMKRM